MTDIGKAGVSAAKWSSVTTIARFGLQLVAQVVLARLLGPDNYGLFGMGLVVFTFSNFLATFGFAWSLAQLQEISDEEIRFAFTWQMIVGILAGAGLFFSAPLIAEYFKENRVEFIVEWMALACVVNAAASTSGNLMRRKMNFKASGLIQLISYGAGYLLIGIPMALLDYGVVALVSAWMTQAVVVAVASYLAAPHPVKPLLTCRQAPEMARIGTSVFLTNIGNWFINNLDRMLVGRILNAHAMGVYTASYNLANMPNTLLLGALQPVFLAAGARVQDEPQRLKRAYADIQAAILNLLLPIFVWLALVSPDIVDLLYGKAWKDAGPVMAILFLGMPAFVVWGMSTPILWNRGKSHWEFALQLPLIPLAALAFWLFTQYGVVAAAAVAAGVLVTRGLLIGTAAFKLLSLPLSTALSPLGKGVLISAILATANWLLGCVIPDSMHVVVRLSASFLVALIVATMVVFKFQFLISHGASNLAVRFVPRLRKLLLPEGTNGGKT